MTERFFRIIFYYIRGQERKLLSMRRLNPNSWMVKRIMGAEMVRFNAKRVSRGMALGMFWGFMPIPFQMLPAALFCWLARANLPVAIVCVWVSNPLTYVPIFYFEYKVGEWLFGDSRSNFSMDEFGLNFAAGITEAPLLFLQQALPLLLKGAMVTSLVMGVVGYYAGRGIFNYLNRRKLRRAANPR